MINFTEVIENDKPTIHGLADSVGIGMSEAKTVVGKVLPVFATGLIKTLDNEQELTYLYRDLSTHNYEQYLENPEQVLLEQGAISDGNEILSHVFKAKEISKGVATKVAEETGVSEGIIKKLLPIIATVVMGAVTRQAKEAHLLDGDIGGNNIASLGGMLTTFLNSGKEDVIFNEVVAKVGGSYFKDTKH